MKSDTTRVRAFANLVVLERSVRHLLLGPDARVLAVATFPVALR